LILVRLQVIFFGSDQFEFDRINLTFLKDQIELNSDMNILNEFLESNHILTSLLKKCEKNTINTSIHRKFNVAERLLEISLEKLNVFEGIMKWKVFLKRNNIDYTEFCYMIRTWS
jgi:hypothetical protein